MQKAVHFAFDLLFAGFCIYVCLSWFRCLRVMPKGSLSAQRLVGAAAFASATISVGLWGFLLVHALITRGYPFYHPVEMLCIRLGMLLGLVGLVGAYLAQGELRRPATITSSVVILLWLMVGLSY